MSVPLPLNREFTVALHSRAIDSCTEIEDLRSIAKQLLHAWQLQASYSEDVAGQLMGFKPRTL